MPDLVWMLSNDLSRLPASLPDSFDQQLLDQFQQRDFSKDKEQQKIMQVFRELFSQKTLINLPSSHQEDQSKYKKQLSQQVESLRTHLVSRM